ncbi:MAG: PAS domain-containing sensor histidine kinase [Sphingobacteriales bacterium]|nr:PAS domain-containing sensor histidine kinase [Sphingobacteriales bacterium]
MFPVQFIVDDAGLVVDLADQLSELYELNPVRAPFPAQVSLFDFCIGLDAIFPVDADELPNTDKASIVLKQEWLGHPLKPVSLHRCTLTELGLRDGRRTFICAFLLEPVSVAVSNGFQTPVDLGLGAGFNFRLFRLLKGSVLILDSETVIRDVMWNGPSGLVFTYGLYEGVRMLSLFQGEMLEKVDALMSMVPSPGDTCPFSFRIIARSGELYVEGILDRLDDHGFLLYVNENTRERKLEEERMAFSLFPIENPSPVFSVSHRGRILFSNDAALSLRPIVTGRRKYVQSPEFMSEVRKAIQTRESQQIKMRIGKEVYLLNIVPSRKSIHANVYAANVTGFERINERLRRQSADMESVLNSTESAVVLINRRFEVLYYNQRADEMSKVYATKAIASWTNIVDYIFPDIADEFKSIAQRCMDAQESSSHYFSRLRDAEGKKLYLEVRFNPVVDRKSGHSAGVCISVLDNTALYVALRNIEQQKNFYETILNNLPTDVAVFDNEHRYLFLNPNAISKMDVRQWMIGKDDFDYAKWKGIDDSMAKRRREMFNLVLKNQSGITWEDQHGEIGKERFMLRKMFPVYKEGTQDLQLVIGYGLDITPIKLSQRAAIESEEKLRHVVTELERNNSRLMQFTYIVSHNLRAPIANLVGLLDFYETGASDPAENDMLFDQLSLSVHRMDQILKDLNEVLTLRDQSKLSREAVGVNALLDHIIHDLHITHGAVDFNVHTDISSVPVVYTSRAYFGSIFYNLLSNAVKYRDSKRPCIIHISSTAKDGRVVFRVSDNGIGIDLQRYGDKVFGLYKRFHGNTVEGTGLGLHLVKTQVEALEGTILISSEPGVGTTFTIELPFETV